MKNNIPIFFSCLFFLSLSLAVSVQAQSEPANVPASLNDATTFDEVSAYHSHASDIIAERRLPAKERSEAMAELYMAASERMLEFAETTANKLWAYRIRFDAHFHQIIAEIEGAEQAMTNFLNELESSGEIEVERVEGFRFQYLMLMAGDGSNREARSNLEAYIRELEAKERTAIRAQILMSVPFIRHALFEAEFRHAEASPENYAQFIAALQTRINQAPRFFSSNVLLGFEIAHKNNVPAEQFVEELREFIQSSECSLSASRKEELLAALERVARLIPGVDPKLYGRTLDDEEFKWESLREKDNEKYVLIKFTATWCVPCRAMIPDLLEAYTKYRDKGFEIVSVYIGERASDPVATVRSHVEEANIPWIILSEALTVSAGQPAHGEHYGIQGVPAIVLVGKDGKIILPAFRGSEWKAKLAEIFE